MIPLQFNPVAKIRYNSHRNSPGPGRGSSIAPNRPAAPGGTEPGSQHHLLRSVPRPGQQQRQHTHRLRFPGPQRSGMGVGLPDHRPPVSASALSAPRHVPIPGPNQRDGRSLRQLAGKKAPSRLRAPSAKSQIPSPPVGDGDRGGHQSL